MSHHSRIDITSIDVCVHARSQHRGIYDTHDTTTAPHTDRPFDAVEGATAISATRFHFMWTCVSADSPSSAPLLSPYFPFFHCRGSDFVTGFEEPDSALLPSSGSFWSSSLLSFKMHLAFLLECCGVMVKNFNKKGICPIRKSKNWIYGVIRPYTFSFFYYIS